MQNKIIQEHAEFLQRVFPLSSAEQAENAAYAAKMDHLKDRVIFGFTLTEQEALHLYMFDEEWFNTHRDLL